MGGGGGGIGIADLLGRGTAFTAYLTCCYGVERGGCYLGVVRGGCAFGFPRESGLILEPGLAPL